MIIELSTINLSKKFRIEIQSNCQHIPMEGWREREARGGDGVPVMPASVVCSLSLSISSGHTSYLEAPSSFLYFNLNLNISRDEMVPYPFVIKL
jgi:hypothetical protein